MPIVRLSLLENKTQCIQITWTVFTCSTIFSTSWNVFNNFIKKVKVKQKKKMADQIKKIKNMGLSQSVNFSVLSQKEHKKAASFVAKNTYFFKTFLYKLLRQYFVMIIRKDKVKFMIGYIVRVNIKDAFPLFSQNCVFNTNKLQIKKTAYPENLSL